MGLLNSVETTLSIAGAPVHFFKLTLTQEFNNHHKLEAFVDFDQLDSLWMNNLASLINKIGDPVIVTMKHRQTGEINIFGGIITNVSAIGHHGEQNYYVVTGMSKSIKLDGQIGVDSFCDKSLKDVVDEIIGNSGNGAAVKNKPIYKGAIDYFCQYNETAFQVLNRLSWMYNEWFFDDGNGTYFGKPDSIDAAELTYDIDISQFNLTANLIPAKYNKFAYLSHTDTPIARQAPPSDDVVRGFIQAALNKSDEIYTSNAITAESSLLNHSGELTDIIQADKSRTIGEMLTFEGVSDSCKVKIGSYVTIKLPGTMKVDKQVEKFLVTKVIHRVDQAGRYSNTFVGVPSDLKSIPMDKPPFPKVGPQLATVVDNIDSESTGRIKVETQWQKMLGKTSNWIRVQAPDAGSSGIFPQNRGFVFIPELGDQVMLAFEYDDPSRPFVQGSMFREPEGRGGGENNNIKTIKTRSGHMIEFNDSTNAETIRIKDINANEILYDTRSKTITISTLEQINLISKTIHIDASEDIVMSAGRDMQVSVGNNFTQATSGESRISVGKSSVNSIENDYEVVANRNIEIESGQNTTQIVGAKLRQDVQSNIDITAIGGKTNISSQGKIEIKSNDKVNIK